MSILDNASYGLNDFKIESREKLYEGFTQLERVKLRHRLFACEDYSPVIQRELIQRKEAAGVLIHDDQHQRFALIEQFRVGAIDDDVSPWQLEIIAGVLDGDESPESCIRRESFEESGCHIQHVEHLFTFYPSAGACDEIFHLYHAQAELPEHGEIFGMADEGENIQLHIIDYTQVDALLRSARLKNAPVIMALQWLRTHILTTIK